MVPDTRSYWLSARPGGTRGLVQITLTKPNMGRLAEGPCVDDARMEPLGVSVLAALTPPGAAVRLWDERVDAVD